MNSRTRKIWLDNLRWATVLSVLLFHCIMMYNGSGVFGGLGAFSDKPQYQDIIMYVLYPFFMPLLFVVAGMSSRYYLENHSTGEYISTRTLKLLVPSTIGLFVFQWITGYLNTRIAEVAQGTDIISGIPGPARYFAYVMSGTGPLWFIQVLWLLSLVLALLRKADSRDRLYNACGKAWIVMTILMGVLMYLCSQTLIKDLEANPFGGLINLYKPQFYIVPFLLGYFVLSHDEVMDKLKTAALPLIGAAVVLGIVLVTTTFGQDPTSPQYLGSLLANSYAYLMILGLTAVFARYLDKTSKFAIYMTKSSFGIYIVHYTIAAGLGLILKMHTALPATAAYMLLILGVFTLSPVLYEILSRIPVLRWCIFGIKNRKMATEYHSKHGIVGRSPMEMYMVFTDLRNFTAMIPEDKKQEVSLQADYDTLTAAVQGISISVKVTGRVPYSKITLESYNSPLAFSLQFNFGDCGGGRTDFYINVSAELNGIMKMMVGGKIQKALDQVIDQLVNASAHI